MLQIEFFNLFILLKIIRILFNSFISEKFTIYAYKFQLFHFNLRSAITYLLILYLLPLVLFLAINIFLFLNFSRGPIFIEFMVLPPIRLTSRARFYKIYAYIIYNFSFNYLTELPSLLLVYS